MTVKNAGTHLLFLSLSQEVLSLKSALEKWLRSYMRTKGKRKEKRSETMGKRIKVIVWLSSKYLTRKFKLAYN